MTSPSGGARDSAFSEDKVHYSSDSSSEMDEDEPVLHQGPVQREKASWFGRLTNARPRGVYEELSIQSGDITRSPPCVSPRPQGSLPSSPTSTSPTSSKVAMPPASDQTTINPIVLVAAAEMAAAPTDPPAISKPVGGLYGRLFPFIHAVVKVLFFSIKIHPRFAMPLASMLILLGNFLLMFVIAVAVFKTSYSPRINVNVEAFGIPDHPAQKHWDAFKAAQGGEFTSSLSPTSATSEQPSSEQPNLPSRAVKRSVPEEEALAFPDCAPAYNTQHAVHRNWEMDLVFRVPEPAAKLDDNILSMERIKRIHEIEEYIYDSQRYQTVCRIRREDDGSTHCYPLNSLLSWFYYRDPKTGLYVYDTPDHFTNNFTDTLRQISKLPTALWFTGGEVNISSDFSSAEARLLRSEIRVGLPLRCFRDSTDRYGEQKALVTEYFASLMPILDEMSTSEVEVLYGGSIIFDYQINQTILQFNQTILQFNQAILHDAYLSAISLALVFFLVFFLSGFSLWLTVTGIYAIVSCFIPAYLVYRGVFGIESISLLNVISIFVVIGIGVDDVFVFINTFKQSARLPNLQGPYHRITHTILEATKATFFTSLTTSVAFLANTMSSIPAVRQFGIFMGLVVLFCFLQVFLVVPHALFVWECFFLKIENFCYALPWLLCSRGQGSQYNALPDIGSVRMSTLARGDGEDDDSGINSVDSSNADGVSNDSGQSDEAALAIEISSPGSDATEVEVLVSRDEESLPVLILDQAGTFEQKLTLLMQKGMFYLSVAPMSLHLLLNWCKSRRVGLTALQRALLRVSHVLVSLLILLGVLGISVGLLAQLQLTNKPPQLVVPPQFFPADSNMQKMLDLAGNVTDTGSSECYDQCSPWARQNNGSPTFEPSHPSNPSNPSSPRYTHPTHPTQTPPTSTPGRTIPTQGPPTQQTPPPKQATVATHGTPTPPVTTPHATPPTGGSSSGPTKQTSTPTSTKPPSININYQSPKYSGNIPVNVVFGIKDVKRTYDPSTVLPNPDDKDSAILEESFTSLFTCPPSQINTAKLQGALRALCRICANISNPDNGLTLDGNHQCLPLTGSSYVVTMLSCLRPIMSQIPECGVALNQPDQTKLSVKANAAANKAGNKTTSLFYLAMTFRSKTNPGASPFDSIRDYNRWDDFLGRELKEIHARSSEGELYEGAEVLTSAFQTSEYWVEINLQIVAVDGSVYGIFLSFVLCSLVVVVLAHDFRIVLSMVVTIVSILLSLGGLFWCFSWKLGIVEAISLSILVGNSLDYCIHLSEGFVAVDEGHLAFLDKFPITALASPRVKRVMAAISFIGVSILSSAITTILAILPLLGTEIQLFARFGEILLLSTAVAIIYTFIICSNCLGFFGPPMFERKITKIVNAALTISITMGFYVVVSIGLVIASRCGVYIPSPQGGELFR